MPPTDFILNRRIDRMNAEGDRLQAAALWPVLCRALDNSPPTPAEIDRIRVTGELPPGFLPPPVGRKR